MRKSLSPATFAVGCLIFLVAADLCYRFTRKRGIHAADTRQNQQASIADEFVSHTVMPDEAWVSTYRTQGQRPDLIIVLAGGVDEHGIPHETVLRRLDAAVAVSQNQVPILCNGGGTSHKGKFVDREGFAIPEASLMARYLISRKVPRKMIFLEGYSDDTIGNAFFARTMHVQWRSDWRKLLMITSNFQLERACVLYKWAMNLQPRNIAPAVKQRPGDAAGGEEDTERRVSCEGVSDEGALPPNVLEARKRKELDALGLLHREKPQNRVTEMKSLEQVHQWLFTKHAAYNAKVTARKSTPPELLGSY